MDKTKVLGPQVAQRQEALFYYSLNIENFKLALEECDKYQGMDKFKQELQERIQKETYQRNKEKIMLDVITKQLAGARNGKATD